MIILTQGADHALPSTRDSCIDLGIHGFDPASAAFYGGVVDNFPSCVTELFAHFADTFTFRLVSSLAY